METSARDIVVQFLDAEEGPDRQVLAMDSYELIYRPDVDDFYISRLNEQNKHTLGCYRCVALLMAGRGAENEELSRIAHLSGVILKPRSDFRTLFSRALEDFGARTQEGSCTLALAGGFSGTGQNGTDYRQECTDMRCLIAERTEEVLGMPVRELAPPKRGPGATDVYYRTAERVASIVQDARDNALCRSAFAVA